MPLTSAVQIHLIPPTAAIIAVTVAIIAVTVAIIAMTAAIIAMTAAITPVTIQAMVCQIMVTATENNFLVIENRS